MGGGRAPETATAWRPAVPGVIEVFHARFVGHSYPAHTHDAWTLLIVDDGAVRYDLDRHAHGALRSHVTLLPPHVPHDGRSAGPGGFRKRVLYLEPEVLGADRIGAAVDRPALDDHLLRLRISQLHRVLGAAGEELAAQSRLSLVRDRLRAHLDGRVEAAAPVRDPGLAARLRDLLDASLPTGIALGEAARLLGTAPSHLVRAFGAAYGLPPHRYLTGRRIDAARRLLLDGMAPGDVAAAAGFYDQAHLTRHFRRMLGTTPGRYRGPR
ncbi:AraC family transcriptional regulator [Pseudonocardia sp.]|uniref:helix-turn-helix transcriptional regulator n=1 Tax=Pseudonocardia sp. TaxID=60912 RepID=UPI003D0C4229